MKIDKHGLEAKTGGFAVIEKEHCDLYFRIQSDSSPYLNSRPNRAVQRHSKIEIIEFKVSGPGEKYVSETQKVAEIQHFALTSV